MDVLYERNVITLLTTITSNIITFMLLGVSFYVKNSSLFGMDKALKEKGIAAPTSRAYFQSLIGLICRPNLMVKYAFDALVNLIKGICKGIPFKYIRLLSSARLYIGYDSQEEFDQDNSGEYLKTTQGDEDDNDSVKFRNYKYSVERVNVTQLPKVWLPKYWPEKIMDARFDIYAPPDKSYISDPTFDGMYSIKSVSGCLFGAVQCISAIILSCIRLQNIDTVHTMDILSMYTSYMLLCVVIEVSFDSTYHCKPVVCIPRKKLKKYQRISSGLSYPKLRLRIYQHFRYYRNWGRRLLHLLLLIPICLMIVLLIYINKYDMLLLSLSVAWIFVTIFGDYFEDLLNDNFPLEDYHFDILVYSRTMITGGLFIALVVCSCVNISTEQKYPSNVNWLPHF
jgi:hypothetical protein